MPPEQIVGDPTDERSDIYAAGIMLFVMLVPKLPLPKFESYEDLLKEKLSNKRGVFLKKPSQLNPHLNKRMDDIVLTATAYEPEKRFANCREFKNALEDYQKKHLKAGN